MSFVIQGYEFEAVGVNEWLDKRRVSTQVTK